VNDAAVDAEAADEDDDDDDEEDATTPFFFRSGRAGSPS